jgi:hypothetical protein
MSDTLQALTLNQKPTDRLRFTSGRYAQCVSPTLEMIQAHFHLPIVEAARALDMGKTGLKKACRNHGIKRWPCQQVRCALLELEKFSVEELNAITAPISQRAHFNTAVVAAAAQATSCPSARRWTCTCSISGDIYSPAGSRVDVGTPSTVSSSRGNTPTANGSLPRSLLKLRT